MTPRFALIKARGNRKQEEIARLCGVKQQTYSHWETGRYIPSVPTMIKLERILGERKEVLFYDVFNSKYELKTEVM